MTMRLAGQGVGPVTLRLWCAKCKEMKPRAGGTQVKSPLFVCADCKKPKGEPLSQRYRERAQ